MEDEKQAAEERAKLRHQGGKKWARDMRRFEGRMEIKENRDDYHEMIRTKNRLKDKQRSISRRVGEEEYDSESDYDEEEDQSDSEMKQKAIRKIKEELDNSGSDENDEDGEASDDDEDSSDNS